MSDQKTHQPVDELVGRAIGLHKRQRLQEAEEMYQRALRVEPDNANALHFLGVLRHQQGKSDSAVALIRQALQIDPSYVGALINLGNVLKERRQFDEAEQQFRQVIERSPDSSDAHNNLGVVLRAQRKNAQAVDAFRRATELSPQFADAFANMGNALKSLDQIEQAEAAYRQAININSLHGEAFANLGRMLCRFGNIEEAAKLYQQWLDADPENPIAKHHLAACRGVAPPRCSDTFVQQSFDSFAASFNEVLEKLEYRAPALVAAAVQAALPPPARQFTVLDAGCGTGLCGGSLRPFAQRLTGIDLSPKMLAEASQLDTYDDLIVAELTEFMLNQPRQYDLIVSADTLIYFGDLAPVFAAAATALRPGGSLIFTLEHETEQQIPAGYQLHLHGRYSHCEDSVRESLEQAGLVINHLGHDTLRKEVLQPVAGLIVTATAPG